MARQKISFGILIFLGFVMVTILYLVVMSGTADIHGTVQVSSRLVSWEESPLSSEDAEMVVVSGYCIKGPDPDNRLLLSTKNQLKTAKVKYSFTAKEGMQHLIVVYLQLDHLTGDIGQTIELKFTTNTIKKGDLKCNFNAFFDKINGTDSIIITVSGSEYDKSKVFEYPVSEIPEFIKL